MTLSERVKRLLLRVWRDVPFPNWMRRTFLRILNPSIMVGAMALIQDEHGRILVLEHTYRRKVPWGLPGGWLKSAESPEAGLEREVYEETGLRVVAERILGAAFYDRSQLDLLYRCRLVSGSYHPTDETRGHRWLFPGDLPALLPNQVRLLRIAGILKATSTAE